MEFSIESFILAVIIILLGFIIFKWQLLSVCFKIAACVLFFLSLPFILPMSIIFRIYRHINVKRIRRLGSNVQSVCPLDGVWMSDSIENPAIINTIFSIKGYITIEEMRNIVKKRILEVEEKGVFLSRKFTQKIERRFRRLVWVDDENFNLQNHVKEITVDKATKDTEIPKILSKYCSMPLDVDKPLWQLYILYTSESDTVALYRIHHVIGDGMALVKHFLRYFVDNELEELSPVKVGTKDRFRKIIKAFYEGPSILLSQLFLNNDTNILHGPKITGEKHVAWGKPIDIDLVKRMKNEAECTINDIMMSVLASGLKNYFASQNASIPNDIRAFIPIDMRGLKSKHELKNEFSIILIDLPLNESDPIKCLKVTQQRMEKIKNSSQALTNLFFTIYCMARLPEWLAKKIFSTCTTKCSLVLSNVPGPTAQMTLLGKPIENIIFWPPAKENVGLGVSILSYNKRISFGVMSDKGIMKYPEQLVECCEKEFKKLQERLGI